MPAESAGVTQGPPDRNDAAHWNSRYADAEIAPTISPPQLLATRLPRSLSGVRALDLACGLGDAGLFMAQRGADVTLVDVSDVALRHVDHRADAAALDVTTVVANLREDGPPAGPFDLITCAHYLDRDMLSTIGRHLATGGQLMVAIATTINLERHARPSARFLLSPGELPTLVRGLELRHHDEMWRDSGVHEAWLIAENSPALLRTSPASR